MSRHFQLIAVTALLFLALFAAVPAGAPVGISYATSDSMAPTIGADDGFVWVPAGDVEPGEIIVFETPTRDRPYAVHRVVRKTPEGFITKGDANEATDQAAGHPPVERSQIRGEVLTVAGEPLVVPNLGVALEFVREHRAALLAIIAGLIVVDAASVTVGSRPSRPTKAGDALRLVAVVSAVSLTVLLFVGGVGADVTFVAVEGEAGSARTVPVGESVTRTVRGAGISRRPLTHVVVDASGLRVREQNWNGSALELSVRVPAYDDPGTYDAHVSVHQYPASLPPSVVAELHSIHPLVASAATTLALILPLYVLGAILVDRSARLRTAESRWRRRIGRVFGR